MGAQGGHGADAGGQPRHPRRRRRAQPGRVLQLARGQPLPVFGSYLCTSNPTPAPPAANAYLSAQLAGEISKFVFGFGTENVGRAPPCVQQAPLGGIIGQAGRFPALQPLP